MSELLERVDSLQNTISKLLHRYEVLLKNNSKLQEENDQLKRQKTDLTLHINNWETKYNTLKTANALLGSKEYKTETKLKINAMIREIDQCIAQLAE